MKNLTVIYPNVSNRTVIKDIKKQLNENDELILAKTSSKTIVSVINNKIEQSKNDDILIINPRDTVFTKKNEAINMFRREGQYCNWLSESNEITARSSFKFNKNNIIIPEESNSDIRNIKQYISYIQNWDYWDYLNKINSKIKSDIYVINFYARESGYKDRGPYIQTQHKINYFKQHINNIKFNFKNFHPKPDWSHFLFPNESPLNLNNISIGPNIFRNKKLNPIHKRRFIVADSFYMKEYLIDEFNIPSSNIFVIPVYINENFFNTEISHNKDFTVGLTGYYENNDIKNFSSLPYIANSLPNIRFELLSSRDKKTFPKNIQQLKNVHFKKTYNDNVPQVMKKWHIYLSMSKRERGPAATQEARTLGIPIITPSHTGYKEFNNCIQLPIEPYKEHSISDIDTIISAIEVCYSDFDHYFKKAQEDKKIFWEEEKNPIIISKKWESFFYKCLGV